MPAFHERVATALPRLTADNYRETSPATWEYNCVAWAAGFTDAWWWPAPSRYWPEGLLREETLPAFLAAFGTLDYVLNEEPSWNLASRRWLSMQSVRRRLT